MKPLFRPIALLCAAALVACTPATPERASHDGHATGAASEHSMDHSMPHMAEKGSRVLRVLRDKPASPSDFAFVIREGEGVFTQYGISHTKEMHLIAVRDDLRHFQHLHPQRDAQGVWHTDFTPGAGGKYWLFADFVDTANGGYTLPFTAIFQGDYGERGIAKNPERTKIIDGYEITMTPSVTGSTASFAYTVKAPDGTPAVLESYLGAKGHSVLISPSRDFIHTHPMDESNAPVFMTAKPSDDFYRVFTQFQIRGKVITVSFDWQP
jgi:hypothetical protein